MDAEALHFVANILFLRCNKCNLDMQMSAVDSDVYKCSHQTDAMYHTCPMCNKEMEIINRKSIQFNQFNDNYGTTVSC